MLRFLRFKLLDDSNHGSVDWGAGKYDRADQTVDSIRLKIFEFNMALCTRKGVCP